MNGKHYWCLSTTQKVLDSNTIVYCVMN